MISNACATMRTARSFFPLFRPFIIRLKVHGHGQCNLRHDIINLPVHEPFNYGHLSLLELFFGVSASGMGKVNGMADLNVICQ
jgi:hypothetical protein